jgi:hypothetical protein
VVASGTHNTFVVVRVVLLLLANHTKKMTVKFIAANVKMRFVVVLLLHQALVLLVKDQLLVNTLLYVVNVIIQNIFVAKNVVVRLLEVCLVVVFVKNVYVATSISCITNNFL